MSSREHARALAAARATNARLDRLFQSSIGSAVHPRGRLLVAYRNARRALQAALALGSSVAIYAAIAEVMASWRSEVKAIAGEVVTGAVAIGRVQASADTATYGMDAAGPGPDILPVLAAVEATVDRQYTQVMAQAALGADAGVLLGEGARVGMMTPAPVALDLGRIMVGLTVASWVMGLGQEPKAMGSRYQKQVVATIDDKTTECCLMAHGQVRAMDEDFDLEGTPQYAPQLPWTPFHWSCRSSVALVLREDADDKLTEQMQAAANGELAARAETGQRQEIWPSHARSRRE